MSVKTKMTAIADAVREKTGGAGELTLDEIASGIRSISVSEVLPHSDIPDYVKEASIELAKKVKAVQKDDSITFLAMSDFHHAGEQVDNWRENINAGNLHAGMSAKILAYMLNFDFMCHLGDVTFGSANTTTELLKSQISEINSYLGEAYKGVPQFRTVGNHDTGEYSTLVGAEYLFNTIGSYCEGAIYGSTEYGYCYRDFEDKKLRVICLNTSEGEITGGSNANYVCSPAQRLWFAQTLYDVGSKENSAEWSVLALSHYPLDYGGTYPMSNIVKAYVEGTSTTESGTTINFNGHNYAKFVANIHGHTHCFRYDKLYSVAGGVGTSYDAWKVATPNACFYRNNSSASNNFWGFTYGEDIAYDKTANSSNDTAFVVNVINPSEQVIHSFCYGAGYDRTIGYAETVYYSITKTLTNTLISNEATSVVEGEAYTTNVTADDGYDLSTVTVTMGGEDVTSTTYSNGAITINSVTGNVVITAVSTKQVNYTNQVNNAINSSGESEKYTDNTYLSSSGSPSAMNGFVTTGFIPIDGKAVHTYRIGGSGITWNEYGARIAWYNSDFSLKGSVTSYDKLGSSIYYPEIIEDSVATAAFKTTNNVTAAVGAAYFRITAKGKGANLIVTIDEPIE